jgi:ankyrin repeat protein
LKQYFSRLSENATQPVQLLLSSSTHTISVSYDPIQKIWIFIDAEGLETRYIQGDNEIAQKVLSSLSNEENENIIFETQIFSPLRDDIVLWKKSLNDILTITPEKSVAVDGFGASWLHLAARNGDIETIESLLNQGASINHLRFDNTTPLHLAAYYGRTDTVKFLLGHGADIDIKNSNDDTVLDFAILSDHMETVKFLLEKNSNIDEERKNGFTLLYSAAATGNTKIVYLLLKAGAAVDKTVNDFTPLQAAEAYEHTETAALIKNGVSLHTAVQNENIMVVNLLLKYDADVNQLNNDGDSPLYLAALNGDSEMVKLLLEKNPDIDKENSNSFTAFYTAAAKGYTEIVKLLLKSGAAVDKSVNGFTPLQAAKAYDHTEIAQIIRQASLIKELSSHSPKHGASSSSGFFFKNPSMMKKSVKIDHPPCSLEAALHQQRQPASTPLIAF